MRKCSRTISPDTRGEIIEKMNKQEHIDAFDDRCVTTLTCEMCGNKLSDWVDAPHLAHQAYDRGWRFQKTEFLDGLSREPQVLCPHCTDNKR